MTDTRLTYAIKNIPVELREALRQKAWENRRSMNQEMIAGLWLHVGRPDQAAAMAPTRDNAPRARRSGQDGER